MKNYICIDGKKAELTEEQLQALGIEIKKEKSPFDRVAHQALYYCIKADGNLLHTQDSSLIEDVDRYRAANYCTDKSIMEQRALHETLNRLLWRYSMTHNGDKIDWNDNNQKKYYISTHIKDQDFCVYHKWSLYEYGVIYFYDVKTANDAIKEIIKPFLKKHPNFKW